MTVTLVSAEPWTAARIDNLLVKINMVLNCRKRRPNDPVDNKTEEIVREARELLPHLEQNPRACTPAGIASCRKLVEEGMG